MKKVIGALALAGVAALTLTGCVPTANQDRGGGAGKSPDAVYDTQAVELYRNADNIPNVAYFCAGDYGWASTLSNDSTSSPTLLRFESYDSVCLDLPDSEKIPLEEFDPGTAEDGATEKE
jgi:hypothetical protein